MESKVLERNYAPSLRDSASGSLEKALLTRLTPSEATEVAAQLVDQFPNLGDNAKGGFLGGLIATLCDYPRQVALRVVKSPGGIASETQWLSIAALTAWCERETEPLRRRAESEARVAKQLRERELTEEQLAKIEAANAMARAAAGRMTYGSKQIEEAIQKHGRPIGRFETAGDKWNRHIPADE